MCEEMNKRQRKKFHGRGCSKYGMTWDQMQTFARTIRRKSKGILVLTNDAVDAEEIRKVRNQFYDSVADSVFVEADFMDGEYRQRVVGKSPALGASYGRK
jgi:hypothetical protein